MADLATSHGTDEEQGADVVFGAVWVRTGASNGV
jgi:hypothetical protein